MHEAVTNCEPYGKFLEQVSNDKCFIIHCGNDPIYLGIVGELIARERNNGTKSVVIDVSSSNGKIGNAYNPFLLKLFRLPNPIFVFRRAIAKEGIEFVMTSLTTSTVNDKIRDIPQDEFDALFEDSIHSALITFSRNPKPNYASPIIRRLRKNLIFGAVSTWMLLEREILANGKPRVIYIPNGRFPHQKIVIEIAKKFDIQVKYFEKGEKQNCFILSDSSILDRSFDTDSVKKSFIGLDSAQVNEIGQNWVNARNPKFGKSTNFYAYGFGSEDRHKKLELTSKKATIFTSSQDEYAALGVEWHSHEWSSQYSAIEVCINHLMKHGYEVTLRVHPNLANKSHSAYLFEKKEIEHLSVKFGSVRVVAHNSNVNSYDLIEESDVVIVWDSTTGLEALVLGVPAWELAPSYYDSYVPIKRWFSILSTPEKLEYECQTERDRAIEFAAYMDLRDIPVSREMHKVILDCIPKSSTRARLAAITVSGGNPSLLYAMLGILQPFIHRPISATYRIQRNKFSARFK